MNMTSQERICSQLEDIKQRTVYSFPLLQRLYHQETEQLTSFTGCRSGLPWSLVPTGSAPGPEVHPGQPWCGSIPGA